MADTQYETLTGKLAEVLRIRQSAAPTTREQVTVRGQHTPCQNTPNINTIYQKYYCALIIQNCNIYLYAIERQKNQIKSDACSFTHAY